MSVFAGVPKATLEVWLADARVAYQQLVTGGQARVFVDQNGERVEYTAASRTSLAAHISALIAAIAAFTTVAPQKRGPIGFWF